MSLTVRMFVIWSLLSALALSNATPMEQEQPLTCPPCICNVTVMPQSACTTQPQTSVGYNDEWELVLKASIGVPMNIYDLWMSDSVLNAVNPEAMSISSRYRINYKSASSNNWENIIKVKVSLLKADEEVVFVDFNGVDSNKVNWFSQDRILRSSFLDLPFSGTMNYASIAGSGPGFQRRFFLQKNYGGCDVDAGWVVIADRIKPGGSELPCVWERVFKPRPAFLYCPNESNCKNNDYVAADTFLILVQRA